MEHTLLRSCAKISFRISNSFHILKRNLMKNRMSCYFNGHTCLHNGYVEAVFKRSAHVVSKLRAERNYALTNAVTFSKIRKYLN